MTKDFSYNQIPVGRYELEHKYGSKVHLISSPYLLSVLARACSPQTTQPEFSRLIQQCYQFLFEAMVSTSFPLVENKIETRMKQFHSQAELHGKFIDPNLKLVTVDIARAGTLPSQELFEFAHTFLKPMNVRQDHFYINRKTDASGKVIGVDMSGSKIGGTIKDAIVVFPDPMGATGGTISAVVSHYKNKVEGPFKKMFALNLIVTPEYIQRLQHDHPDLEIYAIRLDRGLSAPNILQTIPGTHLSEEKGLNEVQYIVPGGGGFGELMNNTEH
jgi:uracil phosphoribosyltransferase